MKMQGDSIISALIGLVGPYLIMEEQSRPTA